MTYERAYLPHWHLRTDKYGNSWCECGWVGRDFDQHLEHVRKVRMMTEYNEKDVARTERLYRDDRPWIIRITQAGGGEARYRIENLTETEVLWIHDALADKIRDVRGDLNDLNHFTMQPENTDAEDAMFLGDAIGKMARMVFLIKDLLSR